MHSQSFFKSEYGSPDFNDRYEGYPSNSPKPQKNSAFPADNFFDKQNSLERLGGDFNGGDDTNSRYDIDYLSNPWQDK